MYFDFTGNGAIRPTSSSARARMPDARRAAPTTSSSPRATACRPPKPGSRPTKSSSRSTGRKQRRLRADRAQLVPPDAGLRTTTSVMLHDLGILLLAYRVGARGDARRTAATGGLSRQLKAAGTLKFRVADIVGYGAIPIWDLTGRTPVRLRRRPPLRDLDDHRARQGEPALHPEPERQRHWVRRVLRRLRLTPARPRHAARPLRDELRQRAVQLEQPELSRRHTAGPGVPRPVPEPAVEGIGDGAARRPVSVRAAASTVAAQARLPLQLFPRQPYSTAPSSTPSTGVPHRSGERPP